MFQVGLISPEVSVDQSVKLDVSGSLRNQDAKQSVQRERFVAHGTNKRRP